LNTEESLNIRGVAKKMMDPSMVDPTPQALRELANSLYRDVSTFSSSASALLTMNQGGERSSDSKSEPNQETKVCIRNYLLTNLSPRLRELTEMLTTLASSAKPRKMVRDEKTGRKLHPEPPPTLLSLNVHRAVYTSLDILWELGIRDFIYSLLGFVPESDDPTALLSSRKCINELKVEAETRHAKDVLELVNTVTIVASHNSFIDKVLERNLVRITTSLLALANAPAHENLDSPSTSTSPSGAGLVLSTVDSQVREQATGALDSLLGRGLFFDVLIVRGLIELVNAPRWLHAPASQLMTRVLLSPGERGLEAVLRAYLDETVDHADALPMQLHVARLITAVPPQMAAAEYFSQLGRQLLAFMSFGVQAKDQVLARVCTLIIEQMARRHPKIAEDTLFRPLAAPLLKVDCNVEQSASTSSIQTDAPERNIDLERQILATEDEVFVSLAMLNSILKLSPESIGTIRCLRRSGIGRAVLALPIQHAAACGSSSMLSLAMDFSKAYMHKSRGLVDDSVAELLSCTMHGTPNSFAPGPSGRIEVRAGRPALSSGGASLLEMLKHTPSKTGLLNSQPLQGRQDQEQESAPSTAEILNLAALRLASEEENNESRSAFGNEPVSGPRAILSIAERSQALSDFLRSVDEGPNTDADANAFVDKQQGSKSGRGNGNQKANGDTPVESSRSSTAFSSDVFLALLKNYLDLARESTHACTTVNASSSRATNNHSEERAHVGLVLMVMQESIPWHVILRDGLKIFRLLLSVVLAWASYMEDTGPQQHENIMPQSDSISGSTPASVATAAAAMAETSSHTRPLIEEVVSPSKHGTPTPLPAAEVCADPLPPSVSSAPARAKMNTYLELDSSVQDSSVITSDGDLNDAAMFEQTDILQAVLAILAGILGLGNDYRAEEEEQAIRLFMDPLQSIARLCGDPESAQAASDIALMIITRSANSPPPPPSPSPDESRASSETSAFPPSTPQKSLLSRTTSTTDKDTTLAFQTSLQECKALAADNNPALRALGVRKLVVSLREPGPVPLRSGDLESAGSILLGMLNDSESYVYLAAVHAIGHLADVDRRGQLPLLLLKWQDPSVSLRLRNKLGEVLMRCVQRAGELVPYYATALVEAGFKVLAQLRRCATQVSERGTACTLRPCGPEVHSVASAQQQTTNVRNVGTFDNEDEAEYVLLRQSAVSLLAETIARAGWSSSKYIREIIDVAVGTLTFETGNEAHSRCARRSATFLLRYVLEGLKSKFFFLPNSGEHFKETYRILKLALRDKDAATRLHASIAYATISQLLREQLFLSEEQLRGDDISKIRVLR
jgi:hypothetical protein